MVSRRSCSACWWWFFKAARIDSQKVITYLLIDTIFSWNILISLMTYQIGWVGSFQLLFSLNPSYPESLILPECPSPPAPVLMRVVCCVWTEGSPEDWRKMLDLNVVALCLCTREAVASMKERGVRDGHIIHINRWLDLLKYFVVIMYSCNNLRSDLVRRTINSIPFLHQYRRSSHCSQV